jgi:hypothetical protein
MLESSAEDASGPTTTCEITTFDPEPHLELNFDNSKTYVSLNFVSVLASSLQFDTSFFSVLKIILKVCQPPSSEKQRSDGFFISPLGYAMHFRNSIHHATS